MLISDTARGFATWFASKHQHARPGPPPVVALCALWFRAIGALCAVEGSCVLQCAGDEQKECAPVVVCQVVKPFPNKTKSASLCPCCMRKAQFRHRVMHGTASQLFDDFGAGHVSPFGSSGNTTHGTSTHSPAVPGQSAPLASTLTAIRYCNIGRSVVVYGETAHRSSIMSATPDRQ